MILIKTVLVDKIYENALLIFESMIFLVYREKKRVRRIKCEKEKDINRMLLWSRKITQSNFY